MRPLGSLLVGRPRDVAPISLAGGGGRGLTLARSGSSSFDQTAQLGGMTQVSTIFGIVDRSATAAAATVWRLYRKAASGLKKDRTEVKRHPALTVWQKPNPFYTQPEIIEAWVQHYQLTGEYWWVLGRSSLLGGDGPPIELWPVRPDRMRPVPSPTEFIAGYIYRAGIEEVPLERTDVIMSKRQNPLDPYRGLSPLGSLALEIYGERAASAYNAAFFENGAEPGGIIEAGRTLTDPEFASLVKRWRESHQGVANAHRVGILEQGQYKQLSYTRKDMQFIELRKFSRDAIREAYAFPKPLLGGVDDINRANAEAAEVVFARWVVNPLNDRLRASLNDDFLPLFGPSMSEQYEFDYDTAVPESREDVRADRNSKVSAVAQLVAAGYDPAETLEVMELPAITFVGKPAGAAPAAADPEPEPAADPPAKAKPAPEDDPDDDDEENDDDA